MKVYIRVQEASDMVKRESIPMRNCEPYIEMYGGIGALVEFLHDGQISNETFIRRIEELHKETMLAVLELRKVNS
jgi:phage host-nuclease inhibitor protein Gam